MNNFSSKGSATIKLFKSAGSLTLKKTIWFLFLLLLPFTLPNVALADDEVKTSRLTKETLSSIEQNSSKFIQIFSAQSETPLDFSIESIKFLDDFIGKNRRSIKTHQIDPLSNMFGAYLGNAIIKKHGGEWVNTDNGIAVETEEYILYPTVQVYNHIKNGDSSSVLAFYQQL